MLKLVSDIIAQLLWHAVQPPLMPNAGIGACLLFSQQRYSAERIIARGKLNHYDSLLPYAIINMLAEAVDAGLIFPDMRKGS